MALSTNPSTGMVSPGPAPGTPPAAQAAGVVGVRQGPQGRPPSQQSSGVVPPPPEAGSAPAGAQGGPQAGAAPSPAPAPPAQPGQPMAPVTPGPELGLMPDGATVQTPLGTYTQTPNGPRLVLNAEGQAAYQRRIETFLQSYRAGLPPEMRDDPSVVPKVVVGQKVIHPWTQQWMTV